MAYSPPAGNDVDFSFTGTYTPPDGDQVHFLFGIVACITINSVSRSTIVPVDGIDSSTINWTSSDSGEYRVEIGGSGSETGSTVDTGYCASDVAVDTIVMDDDITTWSGYSGTGSYRFNIYVKSIDDIWTPYDYTC